MRNEKNTKDLKPNTFHFNIAWCMSMIIDILPSCTIVSTVRAMPFTMTENIYHVQYMTKSTYMQHDHGNDMIDRLHRIHACTSIMLYYNCCVL